MGAWLLITVAAVFTLTLAVGLGARARLAAGLADLPEPGPDGFPVRMPALDGAGILDGAGVLDGAGGSAVSWRGLARLLLRHYRWVIALASWLMLAETALALAAPWPLKVIIDHALGHRPLAGALGPMAALRPVPFAAVAAAAGVVLLASAALLGYLVSYLMAAVSEQAGRDLRLLVVNHLLRIPPGQAAGFPLGELAARVGADAARVSDTIMTAAEVLIPETAVLAGMAAVISVLDWRLTLVALAVVPLLALTAQLRNRGLRAAQQASRQCSGAVSAQITGLLVRLPSVHVFDRADTEIAEVARLTARAAAASVRALDASIRFGPVAEVLPGAGLAAALITGTMEIRAGRLTVGGLLVFLAYLASLQAPVRALARLSTTLSRGQASRDRLAELHAIARLRPAGQGRLPLAPTGRRARWPCVQGRPASRGSSVDMDAVSFAHHPGRPLLRDFQLHIKPGEVLCLTGPSGAGKSTVLALLMRLVDPASGRIRIGGMDISAMPLSQLSRLVTLVPQEPWLHAGSIAANIAYGRPDASPDDIRVAAVQAGVDAFARYLPDRYDTPVGEHGRALSGGQARRIALARALLRGCPVLLLDEPTAGLDVRTENHVLAGLLAATRGKTLVLVSHQPHVMNLADRVLTLACGRAVPAEHGPRPALTATERR